MRQQPSMLMALFVALVLIATIVGAIVILYRFTADNFVLGLAGAVGSVGWAAYQFRKAKEHEADARLFSAKAEVYEKLALLIKDLLQAQKSGGADIAKMAVGLLDIRTRMIVWGSADTIQTLDAISDQTGEPNPQKMIDWLAKLYSSIRKDLGHRDPEGAALRIALGHILPSDRKLVAPA